MCLANAFYTGFGFIISVYVFCLLCCSFVTQVLLKVRELYGSDVDRRL